MSQITHRIFQIILEKISRKRGTHPIYILPTLDGLKVVALNFILLAIGLTYANNYILLFNFILFCLMLASMFYTHFNLSGVKFIALKSNELYANSSTTLELVFQIQSKTTHYFLKPIIEVNGILFEPTHFNISENTLSVNVTITPLKRGLFKINNVGIETRFPFSFFTCFTFFNSDINLIVYPEKKVLPPIKINQFPLASQNNEPDVTHRLYKLGDNLKRVDWKKLAQINRWYTKESVGEIDVPIILENEPEAPLEESLSSICSEIQKIRNQGVLFGLIIDGKLKCAPGTGNAHVARCLKELALHGS